MQRSGLSITLRALTLAPSRVAQSSAHLSASRDSFDPSLAQRIFLICICFSPPANLNENCGVISCWNILIALPRPPHSRAADDQNRISGEAYYFFGYAP